MNKLHWSLDSLIFREGAFFGFGWVFHEEKEIHDLKLMVQLPDGVIQFIHAEISKPRMDLAKHFSQFDAALHSGFLLLGSVSAESIANAKLFLSGTFVDGLSFELNIPNSHVIGLNEQERPERYVFAKQFRMMLQRGMRLIMNREFTLLKQKIGRQFQLHQTAIDPRVHSIEEQLNEVQRNAITLIIDHDLGGGANHYRERLVQDKIQSGNTVLILSFQVANLSPVLMLKTNQRDARYLISNYQEVLDLAAKINFQEVIYNTGVSFTKPEEIPLLLMTLKQKFSTRLSLLIHDFFIVCPSHFLLNDQGNYCDIPNIKQCQSCLKKNQSGFATLYRARDILQWRNLWHDVIQAADQIVTFSDNTLALMSKAYPDMPKERVKVVPHKLEYLESSPIVPRSVSSLKIGVVGQIGYHKGAKFIQSLAEEIVGRHLDIQIIVIGEIAVPCNKKVVQQTGSYQHQQLPQLIRESGANVMLFPSICPETFSYVVHELINLELPVACFNLGAPADKLSTYSRGLVLQGYDVSEILEQLISFHQRIYFQN